MPLVSEARSTDNPSLWPGCVPIRFIWGDKERLALPPMTQEALATIPNARAVEIKDTGHMPFFEDPTRFNAELSAFAEQCFAQREAA